jgi:meiotically up-regulated gene 157 (Mug157) protein
LRLAHENEKRGIKNAALEYAIEHFQMKTKELILLFTNESVKMLSQYTFLREQLVGRDTLLKKAVQYTQD